MVSTPQLDTWSGTGCRTGRRARTHTLVLTEADLLDTPEMRWLRAAAPRAAVALVSNSRVIHRAVARDGVGIACLARYLGDGVPELVRLAAPPTAGPAPVRELWLGVHGDMRHT